MRAGGPKPEPPRYGYRRLAVRVKRGGPKTIAGYLMWRFSKNNGITEGFHNKMEIISRQAYSFRNFDNYRMRVKVLRSRWAWSLGRAPIFG